MTIPDSTGVVAPQPGISVLLGGAPQILLDAATSQTRRREPREAGAGYDVSLADSGR
jgi:hypothetical protein